MAKFAMHWTLNHFNICPCRISCFRCHFWNREWKQTIWKWKKKKPWFNVHLFDKKQSLSFLDMHLKFTKQKQIYRGEKKYLQAQTASSSLLQESAPQCCSKWLPKKLLTPATMLLQDSSSAAPKQAQELLTNSQRRLSLKCTRLLWENESTWVC